MHALASRFATRISLFDHQLYDSNLTWLGTGLANGTQVATKTRQSLMGINFSVASLKPHFLRYYVTILTEHWLGITQYINMQAWLAKIDELFLSLSGFIVVIHDKQNSVFWWQESARGGKISQAALFLKTGGMVESVLHLSPPARNASTLNPGANRSMQSNKWQMLIQRDR